MQTTTRIDPFYGVIFDLDQLLEVVATKPDRQHAVELVEAAKTSARLASSLLDGQAQLEEQLKALLEEVTARWGGQPDDITVTMVQRILADAFRPMNQFAAAEQYDRLDPTNSALTTAKLAWDIFCQNNRQRYPEVIALYRLAIELGLAELPKTIWPSNVRANIGGFYIQLAKTLIASQGCGEAEQEIDNLIKLNQQWVADGVRGGAVNYSLVDAYKLLMEMAHDQCIAGHGPAAARLLDSAIDIAFGLRNQYWPDYQSRLYLIKTLCPTAKDYADIQVGAPSSALEEYKGLMAMAYVEARARCNADSERLMDRAISIAAAFRKQTWSDSQSLLNVIESLYQKAKI